MEKFIMASGVATRCSDIGKGDKTIVLIHGYLESLDVFDEFAGQLGKTHRVITIDLPGSGLTDWNGVEVIEIDFMASVVADALIALGAPPATIVGHSMGGYVAVALAQLFPTRVAKLVLLHSSPYGDSDEKRVARSREIELVKAGKKELLASINPARGFAPQNVRRCNDAIEELAEQIMLTPDDAIVATLKGMAVRADRAPFFAQFATTTPVLIIFGADDQYIPIEARQTMVDQFPNARIVTIENCGHMSFVEQKAQTLALLTEFCDEP